MIVDGTLNRAADNAQIDANVTNAKLDKTNIP
jgi:hypothetical protein